MPNRIGSPVTPANEAENKRLASIAPVSPNGVPMLPTSAAGWLGFGFATAIGGLAAVLPFVSGTPFVVLTVSMGVLTAAGVALGILSAGARRGP